MRLVDQEWPMTQLSKLQESELDRQPSG